MGATMRRPLTAIALALLTSAALAAQAGPNDTLAREVFKELIEINTTDTPAGSVSRAAEAMAARLTAAGFPAADVQLLGPDPRKRNLVARLRGKGVRRPVLLLAHLDVVEARNDDWTTDPFTFLEKDGFFYGRGTTDDKSMAAQFVANMIRLKQEGFTADRDLILALTADEEGGQFNGVEWLLKNHRNLIDAEFAINEGGGGTMRRGKYLTNEVQASEKVYQDFRLEAKNAGGHSSLPVKDNAIYHLAAGLTRLSAFEFPVALNEVTRTYFERSAAVEADPKVAADMRAMAGASVDPAAAARLAASQPYFNALMRTTCVATLVEAGHATNALPQMARANVNCRILPGVPPASVRDKLVEVLADPQITVSFVGEARPSRPSPLRPDVMETVETLTKQMFPGVIVIPTMSTGATDGLYLRNGEIPTYGVDGNFGDMEDVRAHGRDERIGVKQFFEGLEFQYRLIKTLAAQVRFTRAPDWRPRRTCWRDRAGARARARSASAPPRARIPVALPPGDRASRAGRREPPAGTDRRSSIACRSQSIDDRQGRGRTVRHRHRHGAIERDYRRRHERGERVIQTRRCAASRCRRWSPRAHDKPRSRPAACTGRACRRAVPRGRAPRARGQSAADPTARGSDRTAGSPRRPCRRAHVTATPGSPSARPGRALRAPAARVPQGFGRDGARLRTAPAAASRRRRWPRSLR